jgi:hypothetical protein
VEGEPTGRAGQPADEPEQPPAQRLGRDDPRTETDPGGPAGEVVSDDLDRQPGPIRSEPAAREVVQPDPVLEIPDRVLDLGMTAMVGRRIVMEKRTSIARQAATTA